MHIYILTQDTVVKYLTEEAVLRETFSDHGFFFLRYSILQYKIS